MIIWSSRELLESGSYLVSYDGCVFKLSLVYPDLILKENDKLLLQREKAAGILANQIENAVRRCLQNLKEKSRPLSQFQMDEFILKAKWLPWKLGKHVEFSIHGKCVQTLPFCLSLKVCHNHIWHNLAYNLTENQQMRFDDFEDINVKNGKMPSRISASRAIMKEKPKVTVSSKNDLHIHKVKNVNLAIPRFTKGGGGKEKFLQPNQNLPFQIPRTTCRIETSESGSLIKDATRHPELMNSISRVGPTREDETRSGKACQYKITECKEQAQNQREREDGDCKEAGGSEEKDKEQNGERQRDVPKEGDVNRVREQGNENQDIIKHKNNNKKFTYVLRVRKERKQHGKTMEVKRKKSPSKITKKTENVGEMLNAGLGFPCLERGVVKKDAKAYDNLDNEKADGLDKEDKHISLNTDEDENECYASTLIKNYRHLRYDQISETKSSCTLSSQRSQNLSPIHLSTKGYSLRPHRCKSGRFTNSSESQKGRSCLSLSEYSSSGTSKPAFPFRRRTSSRISRHLKSASKRVGPHCHQRKQKADGTCGNATKGSVSRSSSANIKGKRKRKANLPTKVHKHAKTEFSFVKPHGLRRRTRNSKYVY